MLNLNLERNINGKYIVDDYENKGYTQSFCSKSASITFCIIGNDEKKYFVKTDCSEYYKFSLYGELLFSYLAKNNNIPCANIDVGTINNVDVVISENVCDNDAEILTCENLFKSVDFEDYSVEGLLKAVDMFSKKFGIQVEKNLRYKLYTYALMDFLCWQNDRHDENIVFQIANKNGKKTLEVCGLYDNEGVFMFDIIKRYLRLNLSKRRNYRNFSQFENVVLLEIDDKLGENWPVLGIDFSVRDLELNDNTFSKNIDLFGKRLKNRFAKSFALEINNNPKFRAFYENLDLNIYESAVQIYMDTNFCIPYDYLEFADDLLKERKQMIDKYLAKIKKEKMNKDDEDNPLL